MKTKLLIVIRTQFGYHIDAYYYCKYARSSFDITYIGFDAGRPKIEVDGVGCVYISKAGNIIVRYLRLLFALVCECRKDYDVIFIKYFISCSLLKILNPTKRFVFDIRTGNIVENPIKRRWKDFILRAESCCFKHISVISRSLADRLKLPEKKLHILPLGADLVDVPPKQFNSLNLLYVGTFEERRIEDTIEGFAKFHAEYKDSVDISYDIVGDGFNDELHELRNLVEQKGLSDVIRLPGYIHQSELKDYYQRCNVGVSYIPINVFYDCQPPTKTYEYILAGMPVLATSTMENTFVINKSNGILIDDTADSFYEGLKRFRGNKEKYCSAKIKQESLLYTWQNIVENNFIPFINNVAGREK